MKFFYSTQISDILNENNYSKYIKDFERYGITTVREISSYEGGFGNKNLISKLKEITNVDNEDIGKLYHLFLNKSKSNATKNTFLGIGYFILFWILFYLFISSI
jgi:hypothetical protein